MMKLTPAHRLALLACLPAAAGASAGTVTLLSQERSVSAEVSDRDLFNDAGIGFSAPDGVLAGGAEAADDFELFDARVALNVDAEDFLDGGEFQGRLGGTRFSEPTASHRSSFEQRGGDVAFSFTGGASSGAPGGSASFALEVEFALDSATAFRLTGTGRAANDAPRFVFEDASGDVVRSLRSFDVDFNDMDTSSTFVFDGSASNPFLNDPPSNTGILDAGTYRFGASGSANNFGSDSGEFSLTDFGIVLLDSTLAGGDADPPVAIPSPAALPAGLALLGAGLMRRRRDAAA